MAGIVVIMFVAGGIVERRAVLKRNALRKEQGDGKMEAKIVEIVVESEYVELKARN